MVSRYTIVDEPEALELEDDIYRSNVTIEDFSGSTHSLQPIIEGPIGLRTVFYDPRWTPRQRYCCLTVSVVVTCCCFGVLIALFVGLGQVISYINRSDRLKASGLFMVPDLDMHDISVFVYHPDVKYEQLYSSYVEEISQFLQPYVNQSDELLSCNSLNAFGKNKLCRFDLEWLGTNCTRQRRYGFADGSPCILFVLRNIGDWSPVLSQPFLDSLSDADMVDHGQRFDLSHVPLSCNLMRLQRTTDVSTTNNSDHLFHYYPEAGFNISFLRQHSVLPPLMFVQISHPYRYAELHIRCQVITDNISQLEGIHSIEFEYNNPQPDVHEKVLVR